MASANAPIVLTETNVTGLYSRFKKGPRKTKKFYQALANIYNEDQPRFIKIFNLLPVIGYYKDYLYLLEACNEDKTLWKEELEDFIYKRLLKLIRGWGRGDSKPSSLAKWLPREGTHFDKTLNFVSKMSKMLFPEAKSKDRKKLYRKLVVEATKKLNILETHLSQGLSLSNLPPVLTDNNLKVYGKTFMKNPQLKEIAREYLEKKFSHWSLAKLLSRSNKELLHNDLEKNLLKPLLDSIIQRKIRSSKKTPDNTLMVLELTPTMINQGRFLVQSKALVYLNNHEEIIIKDSKVRIDPGLTPKDKMMLIEANLQMGKSTLDIPSKVVVRSEGMRFDRTQKKSDVDLLKDILRVPKTDVYVFIRLFLILWGITVVIPNLLCWLLFMV